MVDIGTQTVSNSESNSRGLSSPTTDAFFAMILNKKQIERADLHSKDANIIDFDPAIVSIG
jgi:hypothetical protein